MSDSSTEFQNYQERLNEVSRDTGFPADVIYSLVAGSRGDASSLDLGGVSYALKSYRTDMTRNPGDERAQRATQMTFTSMGFPEAPSMSFKPPKVRGVQYYFQAYKPEEKEGQGQERTTRATRTPAHNTATSTQRNDRSSSPSRDASERPPYRNRDPFDFRSKASPRGLPGVDRVVQSEAERGQSDPCLTETTTSADSVVPASQSLRPEDCD